MSFCCCCSIISCLNYDSSPVPRPLAAQAPLQSLLNTLARVMLCNYSDQNPLESPICNLRTSSPLALPITHAAPAIWSPQWQSLECCSPRHPWSLFAEVTFLVRLALPRLFEMLTIQQAQIKGHAIGRNCQTASTFALDVAAMIVLCCIRQQGSHLGLQLKKN